MIYHDEKQAELEADMNRREIGGTWKVTQYDGKDGRRVFEPIRIDPLTGERVKPCTHETLFSNVSGYSYYCAKCGQGFETIMFGRPRGLPERREGFSIGYTGPDRRRVTR